jgi:Kef-type K+ transport system membrane component KefB
MSPIAVLVGLLVLAYLGSILVGGRAIRGYGLPSGAEYLMLGFVLGPHVLGVLHRSTVSTFEPIAQVGLSWLGLVIGLDYAFMGERRARARAIVASIAFAVFSGVVVTVAVYFTARAVTALRGTDLLLLSGGIGAVASETTRNAVRWVVERYGAVGPVSELLASIAESDDLVPLVAVAALFGFRPVATGAVVWPFWGWLVATLLLGVALGVACAALLGDRLSSGEVLTFIFGAALLGTGISTQLGLSSLTATFALGLAVSLVSKHRSELRTMLEGTERPVLLPLFVLAGAQLRLEWSWPLLSVCLAAVCARVLAKLLCGWMLLATVPVTRAAGAGLGLGILSSGTLTISVGFAFAMRFGEPVGSYVLAAAVAVTLCGELLGPTALRGALFRTGELTKALASRTLLGLRPSSVR